MKLSHIALLALFPLLAACQSPADTQPAEEAVSVSYVSFGETVAEEGPALSPADLSADPRAYHGQTVRVEGIIRQVCQQAGCWITLDNPAGEPLRVHVPRDPAGDYAWTFPMDLGPRRAIVQGTASADTLSVEDLQHYAEDAGQPQEEVDAITEPGFTATISARGVLVEEDTSPLPPDAGQPAPDVDVDVPVQSDPAGEDRSGAAPTDTPNGTNE